jgi:signal transduction histidine kinase
VDYITKPFQEPEILARVLTHLQLRALTEQLEHRVQERTLELEQANQRLHQEIVEHRNAEQRIRELNEELEDRVQKRTKELHTSLEQLKNAQRELINAEKMASLGGLVAGIAHEINTPVGIGVTAASYLEECTQEFENLYRENRMKRSDLDQYVQIASDSAHMILMNLQQAAALVKNFKQVSVDQMTFDQREFYLREYLDSVLSNLRPHLRNADYAITIDCPEELLVDSYPGAFSQIFTNLIMNSILHGFEKAPEGSIDIQAQTNQHTLHITYHDNGRGMGASERERAFEPFYTSKRGRGGTGLGLYVVYNLVTQKLNGTIECLSAPGEGTTFHIVLPLIARDEHHKPVG